MSECKDVTLETHPLPAITTVHEEVTITTNDRTASVSGSTSTDSDRTPVRVDSQDSQVSDTETITDGHRWPRQNSVRLFAISITFVLFYKVISLHNKYNFQLSMREWDIPYDELQIGDEIGAGRFGKVYRGYWHGDVAIKVLNMEYVNDEKTLEQFKMEVFIQQKTTLMVG